MSRGQFEKWWRENKWGEMTLTGVGLKMATLDAWQARQPEIDALIHDNARLLESLNAETKERCRLEDENAALKEQRRLFEADNAVLLAEARELQAEVERLRAQIRESSNFEFQIGGRVEKFTGDYKLEGIVVGHAVTIAGHVRYVVEHRPLAPGMLHIYGGNNIRLKVGE